MTLDSTADQDTLTAAAGLLNDLVDGRTATQIERALGDIPADHPHGELAAPGRGADRQALRDYDGEAVEEVFSEGLLNVMARPSSPRARSCGVSSRPSRTERISASWSARSPRPAGSASSSATRTRLPTCKRSSLVLAPYGRPGRGIGVVGVLGPTRMAYPQAIGTVRFVSGLMNELVDHLYA